MNIISWNVRGAVRTNFKRVFREMVNTHKLNLVIQTKTRLRGDRANNVISALDFELFVKVDAMGFSGGIWVFGNPQAISVKPISSAFHELFFKIQVNSFIFILTAIYVGLVFIIWKQLWNKLEYIYEFINLPWLLLGDFTEISIPQEKFGGRPPSKTKMETFNNFLNRANLIDLGFIGPKFTWTNCRHGKSII